MAPQVNITTPVDLSGKNMENVYFTKLGAFSFHVWQNMSKEWELPCTEIISTKKLFLWGLIYSRSWRRRKKEN
jgi:hypothetical protein